MALLCLGIANIIGSLLEWKMKYIMITYVVLYLSVFYLCTRTFKNKHNKNDNTSGVATVLSLIEICNKDLYKGTAVKGVLFDMDGVILDTEKLYTRFWQEAANALGYPMTKEQALGMRSLNRGVGLAKMQSYL